MSKSKPTVLSALSKRIEVSRFDTDIRRPPVGSATKIQHGQCQGAKQVSLSWDSIGKGQKRQSERQPNMRMGGCVSVGNTKPEIISHDERWHSDRPEADISSMRQLATDAQRNSLEHAGQPANSCEAKDSGTDLCCKFGPIINPSNPAQFSPHERGDVFQCPCSARLYIRLRRWRRVTVGRAYGSIDTSMFPRSAWECPRRSDAERLCCVISHAERGTKDRSLRALH